MGRYLFLPPCWSSITGHAQRPNIDIWEYDASRAPSFRRWSDGSDTGWRVRSINFPNRVHARWYSRRWGRRWTGRWIRFHAWVCWVVDRRWRVPHAESEYGGVLEYGDAWYARTGHTDWCWTVRRDGWRGRTGYAEWGWEDDVVVSSYDSGSGWYQWRHSVDGGYERAGKWYEWGYTAVVCGRFRRSWVDTHDASSATRTWAAATAAASGDNSEFVERVDGCRQSDEWRQCG